MENCSRQQALSVFLSHDELVRITVLLLLLVHYAECGII